MGVVKKKLPQDKSPADMPNITQPQPQSTGGLVNIKASSKHSGTSDNPAALPDDMGYGRIVRVVKAVERK